MKIAFFIFLVSSSVHADTSAGNGLENLKFIQGDEEGNDRKALKAEMLVSATEQKAIAQVKKLISKYKGSPLEADLQLRLAEMYMRKSKSDRFFELHRESSTDVKVSPRVVKKSDSRNSLNQAVETYQYIQKKFPNYAQLDTVIFNHAFARQALGQEKEAENLYINLIKKFPDSPLLPDSYLAVGEIQFQQAHFEKALEYFSNIRKFTNTHVYPYGLYKIAWTHYNMRNAAEGLKVLEEVVAYGDMVAKNNLDAKLDLRKEALSDMTLFFEDVNSSKAAYAYFKKQAGPFEVSPLLMKLADLYQRHARWTDEREVLKAISSEMPTAELTPTAHSRLVTGADALKDKKMAVDELESFHSICKPKSKFVAAHPELQPTCVESLQKTSLLMAQKWLKIWNKNVYDDTFADASEQAFAVYLRNPKKDSEFFQSRFLYAELLFKRKKFRRASEEYAAVAAEVHDKVGHDAAYGACLSLQNAVGEKWSPEDEKRFNELAKFYVKYHPQGPYRLEVEFKMGFLAYEKGRYDEAAPIFQRLGSQYPKDEKGLKAQDLYLDILNIQKDYHGLRLVAKDLIKKNPEPQRLAKIRKVYEQAYFLEIQKIEEKGESDKAIAEYQVFAKENPSSDLAEKADWNVVQLHFKSGNGYAAAQSSLDFARRYPNSAQSTPALASAAKSFEDMGQLHLAAEVLIQLSEKDPKGRMKWRELAADYYALSGNTSKARVLYKELMESSKDDRILEKLLQFEKSYGSPDKMASVNSIYIQRDLAPIAGEAKLARLQKTFDEGDDSAAFQDAKKLIGSSSLSSDQKAKARFIQAKVLQKEFESQSVKAKPERLAMVLSIKTEKLAKAEEAFQATIKYGDPQMTVDSMEELYNCFHHYVTALRGVQPPPEMSPQEASAFSAELEKLIIPLEEKSVDMLSQGLAYARKHPQLEPRIRHLEALLADLNKRPLIYVATKLAPPQVNVAVKEGRSL